MYHASRNGNKTRYLVFHAFFCILRWPLTSANYVLIIPARINTIVDFGFNVVQCGGSSKKFALALGSSSYNGDLWVGWNLVNNMDIVAATSHLIRAEVPLWCTCSAHFRLTIAFKSHFKWSEGPVARLLGRYYFCWRAHNCYLFTARCSAIQPS